MEASPGAALPSDPTAIMTGHSIMSELNLDAGSVFLLLVTVCAFMIPVLIILPPVPIRKSDALLQTHSLAGVRRAQSNLNTQYAPHHGRRDGKPNTIQSLMVYPVKSCRGIELTRSRVLPQGLEFDRMFTFAQLKGTFPVSAGASADAEEKSQLQHQHHWVFITQRQFPRLATVKVDLWLPDDMKLRRQSLRCREAFLTLRFPWKETGWRGVLSSITAKLSRGASAQPEKEILLPVEFPSAAEIKEKGYSFEDVKIWSDTAAALNMSAELPEELQLYLGVSNMLGLFRVDPGRQRKVSKAAAPTRESAGYQPVTRFQDAFPVNVMSLSSIQQLGKDVPKDSGLKELDVRRFRPNVILSGSEAYEEEQWKRIRFKPGETSLHNDALFDVSCRTVRCKLPNVDQESGTRHPKEPDRTLRATREVDENAKGSGCLGMQLTPLFEDASIAKANATSGLLGDDGDDEYTLSSWVEVGMVVEVEQQAPR